ncbi:hypothetical protein KI387_011548, partial [Taxus chinensis]
MEKGTCYNISQDIMESIEVDVELAHAIGGKFTWGVILILLIFNEIDVPEEKGEIALKYTIEGKISAAQWKVYLGPSPITKAYKAKSDNWLKNLKATIEDEWH